MFFLHKLELKLFEFRAKEFFKNLIKLVHFLFCSCKDIGVVTTYVSVMIPCCMNDILKARITGILVETNLLGCTAGISVKWAT